MGSKTPAKTPAQLTREGGVVTQNVLGQLAAKGAHAAAPHAVPWLLGAGLTIPGFITHELWGSSPWAAAGLTVSGSLVTGATWLVSRWRHTLGRFQSTATAAAASGYLLAATITGPFERPTIDLWLWAGGTLCALWNVRNIIQPKVDPDGTMVGPGGPGALFKRLFTDQERVDVEAVRNVQVAPTAIKGTIELGGGDTIDDLRGAIPGIEAERGLPPGSLNVTPNRHNAGLPLVTLTNPLLLEDPIPWPGPSRPGKSVAEPLRVAMFQDGTPMELLIPGGHIQIMGMTGVAKTTGIAWSIWGELITRKDVAVIVVDITKGEQTVGPVRPALHGAVTDKATARKFFKEWLPAWAQERLDEFGKHGLIAWEPGCGFSYLVIPLEEAADIFEHIDMEEFVNLARMLRSAGGGFIWSLQRADSTQMPTIVKGQGGGKICGGVESDHDAKWGLTKDQERGGASPDQWRAKYPGMAYADTQGVPNEKVAMPSRFYDWGTTNRERVANFAAHCAAWPASARPADRITVKLLDAIAPASTPGANPAMTSAPGADRQAIDDQTKDNSVNDYLAPDPELDAYDAANPVDPDAELPDVPHIELGGRDTKETQAEKAARLQRAYRETLAEHFGDGREFATADIYRHLASHGMSRTTVLKYLKADIAAGVIAHDASADQPYSVRVLAGV